MGMSEKGMKDAIGFAQALAKVKQAADEGKGLMLGIEETQHLLNGLRTLASPRPNG